MFSEIEEDFFRAGDEGRFAGADSYDSFDDLDEGYQPSTVWSRLTDRVTSDAPAQSFIARRAPTARPGVDDDGPEDDDWDWQIAIARARLAVDL